MKEKKVNPLSKGKHFPGRQVDCMCLVFVGFSTRLNGGIIAWSCNSVYSEFPDFF